MILKVGQEVFSKTPSASSPSNNPITTENPPKHKSSVSPFLCQANIKMYNYNHTPGPR